MAKGHACFREGRGPEDGRIKHPAEENLDPATGVGVRWVAAKGLHGSTRKSLHQPTTVPPLFSHLGASSATSKAKR